MAETILIPSTGDLPAVPAAALRTSLFGAIKASIGPEIPQLAGRHLGLEHTRAAAALDLLALATLRRLSRRSASIEGASRLFTDLGSQHLDDELAAALDRLEAGPRAPAGRGRDPAVRHLQYSVRWVVYSVATATGLPAAAVRELVALATLLVLVGLRESMHAGALDAKALRQRLADEHPSGVRFRLRTLVEACTQARSVAGRDDANGARGAKRRPLRSVAAAVLVLAVAVAAALVWRDVGDSSGAASGRAGAAEGRAERAPGSDASAAARPDAVRLDELKDFLSAGPPEGEFVFALDGVLFEPDSAMLDSSSNAQLRALAAVLARHPKSRTTLAVRAEGDDEDAMELAKNRAVAVRAALAVFGVPLSRTHHAGVGGSRSSNDRVEARVGRT